LFDCGVWLIQALNPKGIVIEVPDFIVSDKKGTVQVLHVDDDSCILKISKQILVDMDDRFDFDHAHCVDEAFKKIATGQYDIIISDYDMPQKNGLQFLEELRKKNCGIPFILFTGKGREEVAIKALNLGADGYVNKQGNPETVYGELFHLINQILKPKQAELSHIESEAKYRNIFSNSGIGMFRSKLDGSEILDFNEKYLNIFGLTREEMQGKRSVSFWADPLEREEMVCLLKANGFVKDFECKMLNKQGAMRYCLTSVKLYPEQGILEGSILDVTERKANEDKLRESQYLTQKMLDCSPNLIYIYDLVENCNVYANRGVLDFLGYTPLEIKEIGSELFDNILHPDDVQVVAAHHARFVNASDNATFEIEYRMKHSSGEWRWLHSRDTLFARTQEGLGTQILGICEDITDRKKAEDALKESEKRSRAIVANSPIGIATSGANKHFINANEAFCKIMGYTEDELLKLTFKEITHREDLEESVAKMHELENGKISSFTLEKRYIRKDGTVIDGKIMVSAVRNQNGEPNIFVAELEDITEFKKAEEHRKVLERKVNDYSKHLKCMVDLRTAQLKDANERLVKSERLAAIGELAGMIGHDLRNPLAGIRNATYFLKKKGKAISDAQAKEMLEIIDNAISHSDKIINDLLDYSREMHLEVTESTLPTLLDTALRMIQVPNRIQILNHVHEEAKITVDTDKIIRIFVNLIKNAIEAMPDQGTLEISSCQKKDCVEIVFADTGKGIPEETLPKIFTPLFTTKAQGMGFGLAICKRITDAHGGTITVKTVLNKGTTFVIFLPKNPKVPLFENQPVLENQNAN
jgi:PAS domain S-box-containing protein